MPFAENHKDGTKIYYETFGNGPSTILLHHGFTRSIVEWKPAYTDVLSQTWSVIAMDARGHGQSDKPHDPQSYVMETKTGDVTAVLDAVGTQQAHYVGYSMGGQIGFGMGRYAPERLLSLTIGGMHPYQMDSSAAQERAESLRKGIEVHVAELEEAIGPLPEPWRTEFLANDGDALAAVILGGMGQDLSQGIKDYAFPTMLYCGTKDIFFDGAKKAAAEIPNARFAALEGLDHLAAVMQHERALPVILDFLQDIEG